MKYTHCIISTKNVCVQEQAYIFYNVRYILPERQYETRGKVYLSFAFQLFGLLAWKTSDFLSTLNFLTKFYT